MINIITRASRKEPFLRCLKSITDQTYRNFHHIITYETNEMKDWLLGVVDTSYTTLVRVPKKEKLKWDENTPLTISYNYNCLTDNRANPDYEFLDYRVEHPDIHHTYKDINVDIPEEKRVEGMYNFTFREYQIHFPFNYYLKIAEGFTKEGWVMYLDDDDIFIDDKVLEKTSSVIKNEDVLHIFPFKFNNPPHYDEMPNEHHRNLYRQGKPFIMHQISSVNLCFHTKYLEYTQWDEWARGDYRTAKSLEEIIPNVEIHDRCNVFLLDGTNGGENIK